MNWPNRLSGEFSQYVCATVLHAYETTPSTAPLSVSHSGWPLMAARADYSARGTSGPSQLLAELIASTAQLCEFDSRRRDRRQFPARSKEAELL